jgi:nucleotide-binding universal stress UspA family protein
MEGEGEVASAMAVARRVGVAMDFSPCSRNALQWAADNVARSGDYLILVTAIKPLSYDQGSQIMLWESSGSRLYLYLTPFLSNSHTHTRHILSYCSIFCTHLLK